MNAGAYRSLADLLLIAHVGFVLFVILGLLAIVVGGCAGWQWIRNPWFRAGHLAAIGLVVLNADFTFVNEPLAKLYGIESIKGDAFVRVRAPAQRGGVLTTASLLSLNSNATRTSPVKRGKFIPEEILHAPPPPPPPDVPPLDEGKPLTGTLRQIMEQHRANPTCASCHAKMDPLGFAFKHFDAIGAWRATDAGGFPIDASGVLPDGHSFDGVPGLKAVLETKGPVLAQHHA